MPANQVDAPRSRQQPILQGEKCTAKASYDRDVRYVCKTAPRRRAHGATMCCARSMALQRWSMPAMLTGTGDTWGCTCAIGHIEGASWQGVTAQPTAAAHERHL